MSVSEDELKRYYKLKAKKPELCSYDDDGNLVEKNKDGSIKNIITLPKYRPPTFEELDEMNQKRMSEIAQAEQEYENAREELRKAMNTPDTMISDILRLNRKVGEADIKLQSVSFPLHDIVKEQSVETRFILFDQKNEKRKLPYPINILVTRPFTLQEQYVRVAEQAPTPIRTVAQIQRQQQQQQQPNIPVILFAEPYTNDNGYLSMKWDVIIDINDTQYTSAYQALMASMAIYFEDETNLAAILDTTNPDEISYSYTDLEGDRDTNEAKWNAKLKELLYDINLAKFTQHPELGQKLIETGNARLGYYEPDDNLLGIGISLDNINSNNPAKWSGQNWVGDTLQQVRTRLKELQKPKPTAPRRRPQIGTVSVAQQQPQQQQQQQPVVIPRLAPPPQPTVPRRRPQIGILPTSQ